MNRTWNGFGLLKKSYFIHFTYFRYFISLYRKKSLPWTSFGKDGVIPVLHLDRTPIQNLTTTKCCVKICQMFCQDMPNVYVNMCQMFVSRYAKCLCQHVSNECAKICQMHANIPSLKRPYTGYILKLILPCIEYYPTLHCFLKKC
jgi:hypothetical protein